MQLLPCRYGGDQVWLGQTVHPLVKNLTLLHASWHCKKYSEAEWRGFPTQRIHNRDFVVSLSLRQHVATARNL